MCWSELGVRRDRPLAVVRTAPSYALYLGGSENALLRGVLERLAREGAETVVLARNDEQRRAVDGLELGAIVPERAVDGRSLVAFADLLVSAGGTMNREAAVLGTPVWSIFEGKLGAVDEQLAREGRLRFLKDPGQLTVERKPSGAYENRVRRDPGALLRLALPWLAAAVTLALVLTGCGGNAPAKEITPRAYLDHALGLMRTKGIYADRVDWPSVRSEADRLSRRATTAADTHVAVGYAVRRLRKAGDLHAGFLDGEALRAQSAWRDAPESPPPRVVVRRRVGYVHLPPIGSAPEAANSRRYEAAALSRISALQTKEHPCGWVIDLQENTGGDMYPMLLAVGPILGEGRLIGFADRSRPGHWVSYRNGTLESDEGVVRAPREVPDLRPRPPVAVVTSLDTASSGEAVAVAFRGRPSTRTFGTPTAGAPNSPQSFPLSDGAALRISTHLDVDRTGTVYRRSLEPDVYAPTYGYYAPKEVAARWVRATPGCTSSSAGRR